jgi:hypothetical protein
MRKILITPPFSSPLYILPIGLWLLDSLVLLDPCLDAVRNLKKIEDGYFIEHLAMQSSAILFLPFIALMLFLILHNYPGCVPLFAWNPRKQGLSIVLTALFLSMILYTLLEVKRMLSLDLPLNALVCSAWVYLYLAFRSVMIQKTEYRETVLLSTDSECKICPKCKLEQWKGYQNCQRCSINLS